MRRARKSLVLSVAVAMVAAAVITPVASVASATSTEVAAVAAAGTQCTQKDGEGQSTEVDSSKMDKKRRPVVFVHGWTGTAGQWTSKAEAGGRDNPVAVLEQQTDNRIQHFLFDYGRYSTQWANNDKIAACLGHYITQVGEAWKKTGGDGKVIVIAHSMGGLATLYSTTTAFAAQPSGNYLGGVITFNTPYLGSPFGGNSLTLGNITGGVKEIIHAWEQKKLIPATSSDALTCLAPHRKGARIPSPCSQPLPPPLPEGVPLTAISGNITVHRSTMFGLMEYDLPLSSDGIVPLDSQYGYLNALEDVSINSATVDTVSKIDNCSITTGELRQNSGGIWQLPANLAKNVAIAVGGFYDVYSDLYSYAIDDDNHQYYNQVITSLLALKARCSHINMIHDQSALDMATEALKTYLEDLDRGGISGGDTDAADEVPDDAQLLSDLLITSGGVGRSGDAVSTVVSGKQAGSSTIQWVGCDGIPAYAEYEMDGEAQLVAWLGFRDFAPTALEATVDVLVDGALVQSIGVDNGGTDVDIDLPHGSRLRLEASVSNGTCGSADEGYMAWGNGYLEPADTSKRAGDGESLSASSSLSGDWEGPVDQPGSRAYSTTVTIAVVDGEVTGTASYPELGCSGPWTQTRITSPTEVELFETITDDPQATCATRVPVEVTLSSTDQLTVQYQSNPAFTATLSRVGA